MPQEKKLNQEAALRELRRKEREEQHLYLGVRVITEDTFQAHGGTDLTVFEYSWNENSAAARTYRLLRKSTVKELTETVGEDIGVDPRRIRFWCMVNRQNKTVRPDTPISDFSLSIEEAYQRLAASKGQEFRIWAEVSEDLTPSGEPVWPATPGVPNGTAPKSDLIILFLKHFDVDRQLLHGIGHIYISKEKKVEDLVPAILKKMNWPGKNQSGEKTMLKLFEVCDSLYEYLDRLTTL
jgi:ubiquitin carboxyl-terminal hydrolase 7